MGAEALPKKQPPLHNPGSLDGVDARMDGKGGVQVGALGVRTRGE